MDEQAMATRHESDNAAARGPADWLCLAAAPTFALMAVLTAFGGGPADILCSPSHGASALSGMAPMYALMSAFHSPAWLKLIAGRRGKHADEQEADHAAPSRVAR
jgi:hypothetical protein